MTNGSTTSSNTPRRIPFEGVANFRDLGGYVTAGGQSIAWRRLYRSDSLAELTDQDHELWRELGIRAVCDLRLTSERDSAPDRLPQDADLTEHHIGFLPEGANEMLRAIRAGELNSAEITEEVIRHYRRLPLDHLAEYRAVFDLLDRPQNHPVVIHCTSGKDRTGLAIALILLALGIPEDQVLADYVLTNSYRRDVSRIFKLYIGDAEMQTLTSAQPVYFTAALGAMQREYGSTRNYLRDGIGLDDTRLKRLRAAFLEEA